MIRASPAIKDLESDLFSVTELSAWLLDQAEKLLIFVRQVRHTTVAAWDGLIASTQTQSSGPSGQQKLAQI
jgi:hypothetical protein